MTTFSNRHSSYIFTPPLTECGTRLSLTPLTLLPARRDAPYMLKIRQTGTSSSPVVRDSGYSKLESARIYTEVSIRHLEGVPRPDAAG